MIKRSVSFHTFGCRLNQAETASLENSFESRDYAVVPANSLCDIAVINTCTVTENGDADTRRLVNKLARRNPSVRIALVGCQAQVQKEGLADLPNVRWIVGNQRKMELVDVLEEANPADAARIITPTIERDAFTSPMAAVDRAHTRANIKIQDGCDFFCAFCEIPYARGRARSRVFEDILLEARVLASAGHKELVMTGINIGTYHYQGKGLLDVILALERIDGIERIRISSIEPTTIPYEILDLMKERRKLCRYLHVPLQSGHDEILSAMKRRYSVEEFSAFIKEAHERVPGICIGTDVIVGFPGETNVHFSATENLLRELPIDYFHVFSYSPRRMAKSHELHESVPVADVVRRSGILRELSRRKRSSFYESLSGLVERVICEERKENYWVGFTDNYVKIRIKTQQDVKGKLLTVKLTSLDGHYMEATMYGIQRENP